MKLLIARRVISAALALTIKANATLLSDSFIGTERAALQDALPGSSDDAFQSFANPAWAPEHSRMALISTAGLFRLNHHAYGEKPVALLNFALQQRRGRFSYGFFATLPTGSQAILDTGDSMSRTAPWINMNRQLLFAANVSRSFADDALRVGLLVPMTFDATAAAHSELDTADVRSRASVELKPHFGWGLGATLHPATLEAWKFSLFFKQPSSAQAEAEIDGFVPLFALHLLFKGISNYSFDPRRLQINAVHEGPVWTFGGRIRFSQWTAYSLPFIQVTESSPALQAPPRTRLAENAWDVAAGAERKLELSQTLAGSLGWRQSPFKKIESFWDSDELILGLGWSKEFFEAWSVSTTLRFHILTGGVVYTWAGLGIGCRL